MFGSDDTFGGQKMTHKVKVEPLGEGAYRVFIDGQKIRAKSIDLHMSAETIPEIDVGIVGEPELEVEGLVQFDYTPKTIKHAVNLLKAALEKNDLAAYLGVDSLNRMVDKLGR